MIFIYFGISSFIYFKFSDKMHFSDRVFCDKNAYDSATEAEKRKTEGEKKRERTTDAEVKNGQSESV